MKKIIFILSLFFILDSAVAQTSIIKTNPLSVFEGFVSVCYEKTFASKSSYQLSAYLGYDLEEVEGAATAVDVGYRRYITKKDAPRGFYLMPHVSGVYTSSSSAVSAGMDLGYQWRWNNSLVLDTALGPNFYHNFSDKENQAFDGGELNLVLALGYSF